MLKTRRRFSRAGRCCLYPDAVLFCRQKRDTATYSAGIRYFVFSSSACNMLVCVVCTLALCCPTSIAPRLIPSLLPVETLAWGGNVHGTIHRNKKNKAWTGKVLEDALRLLILYAEKQMTLRASKSDYCPKDDTAAIEATRTVKVYCRSFNRRYMGLARV